MTGQDLFSLLNNMNVHKFKVVVATVNSARSVTAHCAHQVSVDFTEETITIWANGSKE